MRIVWGLLFTCMASQAIHVDIVTSLTLKDFLLAFSRFNDVRGKVEVIYSNNVALRFRRLRKLYLNYCIPRSLEMLFVKKESYGNLSLRMLRHKKAPESRW